MRDTLLVWYRAARPFTLSASIIPVAVGSALAFRQQQFSPFIFILVLVASLLVQAGANMVDEFSDHALHEGKGKLIAPYKVIALGLLSSRAVKLGAATCFGVATLIGIYLISVAGWPILVISLASAAVAYFYAAGPRPLGSIGLGHVLVFIFMGPVMVVGAFYVQTQTFSSEALWLSLPFGCTVTAILIANDLRDMDEDKAARKITPVTMFGRRFGQWEWTLLVVAAFLVVIGLTATGGNGLWNLLSLLAVVPAVRAANLVWRAKVRTELAKSLPATSRLHMQFGLLLSLGLVLSRFFQM